MKKKNLTSKLQLKKEVVSNLMNSEMRSIKGGDWNCGGQPGSGSPYSEEEGACTKDTACYLKDQ
ncbi:MAG: class I lanthipeptide [Bacteroidota bacterium]